jgi:hypothetical protein
LRSNQEVVVEGEMREEEEEENLLEAQIQQQLEHYQQKQHPIDQLHCTTYLKHSEERGADEDPNGHSPIWNCDIVNLNGENGVKKPIQQTSAAVENENLSDNIARISFTSPQPTRNNSFTDEATTNNKVNSSSRRRTFEGSKEGVEARKVAKTEDRSSPSSVPPNLSLMDSNDSNSSGLEKEEVQSDTEEDDVSVGSDSDSVRLEEDFESDDEIIDYDTTFENILEASQTGSLN